MNLHKRQYTIRAIPPAVDRSLRQQAKSEGKSLNTVLLEALYRGAGLQGQQPVYTDLDDCIGAWQDDPGFDAALAEQDVVDERLWR